MLTTRVSSSLGSALQTSPEQNMTHCSGTFFLLTIHVIPSLGNSSVMKAKFLTLFHCHKFMRFGASILRPAWFRSVTSTDPLKPWEVDNLRFWWPDASLWERKPEDKMSQSLGPAPANIPLSYIYAFLGETRYREQPVDQGLWEHGPFLPSCLGCAST